MRQVFEHFDLQDNTVDFIGHALALHANDEYLDEAAVGTMTRLKKYIDCKDKNQVSPFQFPTQGIGQLSEKICKLCARRNITYLMGVEIDEIIIDHEGKFTGLQCREKQVKAPILICDTGYGRQVDKVDVTGKVVRAICLMDHAIPNTLSARSMFITMPQK